MSLVLGLPDFQGLISNNKFLKNWSLGQFFGRIILYQNTKHFMKYTQPKIIKEKQVKKESIVQFWRIFLNELILLLPTYIITICSAFELNILSETKKIYLPKTSLQDFLFSFSFVMFFVLIFVLYKNKKIDKFKGVIYKGLFIVTVFWGGMTILNLFLTVFATIIVMGVLIMLWLKSPSVWAHDVLMILGLAGSASFFGLGFSPSVVVALLLIFSVYDFIAVYKTKHMVAMLKEMAGKGVILGFIVPKEIKYFKSELAEVKAGGNFMILGGGDVILPGLLAVSVVPFGIIKALIIIAFSLLGLFFSYWLFSRQDKKEPIPALPPIALFSIVGYFITLLL